MKHVWGDSLVTAGWYTWAPLAGLDGGELTEEVGLDMGDGVVLPLCDEAGGESRGVLWA
jgi:hypothetical protein